VAGADGLAGAGMGLGGEAEERVGWRVGWVAAAADGGAVAATAFGTVVLGPRYLLSLGVSALLPLAFLSPGNSGLLLWLAAGLALASLLWPRARRLSGVLEIR